MRGLELTQQRDDLSDEWKIQAKEARWLDGRWWFKDVVEQRYDAESNPLGPARFIAQPRDVRPERGPGLLPERHQGPRVPLLHANWCSYLETHQQRDPAALNRIRVDLHYRLAEPWTCLVVTLLGIPFGAQTGRRGAFLGVALSIGLFFAYYVLIHIGLSLGKNMVLSPWVAGWSPNALFLALGAVMTYRMR
jgi:lipopolysaccharide export system permease protein